MLTFTVAMVSYSAVDVFVTQHLCSVFQGRASRTMTLRLLIGNIAWHERTCRGGKYQVRPNTCVGDLGFRVARVLS